MEPFLVKTSKPTPEESTNNQDRILLPGKMIIKEKLYRSIEEVLPWNLRTTLRRENLFYVLTLDIHIGPLLMDLSKSSGSEMVVEDHRSMEGVILETCSNRTTTIFCSLNKRYRLPDKP